MEPCTGEGDLFEIPQVILSSEAGHVDDVDRALYLQPMIRLTNVTLWYSGDCD
jgi:hypothetical protein